MYTKPNNIELANKPRLGIKLHFEAFTNGDGTSMNWHRIIM